MIPLKFTKANIDTTEQPIEAIKRRADSSEKEKEEKSWDCNNSVTSELSMDLRV